jgi:DNA polymerase-3 subunit alpha
MEFYLKSAEDMSKIFGNTPNCFTNSIMMAERINSKDIEENLFGGMRLPKFELPENYKNSYEYLKCLALEGMKKIGWDKSKKHVDALNMELNDVRVALESNNYDFATYFLIVRDYIKYARDNGILVGAGRGSGYASILLRCLGITYGIDPLKYGLLWERFLGFDTLRFIREKDFGFEEDFVQQAADVDLEEDRDVEDDMGGVDRY